MEAPAGIADHEIDKAPRDFPNDLLHDLDTLESRRDEYRNLHRDVLELAVKRSLKLRDASLRKRPATGELLVWLPAPGTYPERLYEDLSKLRLSRHLAKGSPGHRGPWGPAEAPSLAPS